VGVGAGAGVGAGVLPTPPPPPPLQAATVRKTRIAADRNNCGLLKTVILAPIILK
jgi:hypothetical protein